MLKGKCAAGALHAAGSPLVAWMFASQVFVSQTFASQTFVSQMFALPTFASQVFASLTCAARMCAALMFATLTFGALGAFAAERFEQPVGDRMAVAGRERLDATFAARVLKGAAIETCPQYSNLLTVAVCNPQAFPAGTRFPQVQFLFFGADGRRVAAPWLTQGSVLIWTTARKAYRHSAYVPEGAVQAQLCVLRLEQANEVEVADVRIRRLDGFAQPTRNVNPMFDYGLFNTSGYTFMGSARARTDAEGRNWFDLLQGSCYPDAFPVNGGEELEIRFHGKSPTWLHWYVCFYPTYADVGNLNRNRKFFVLDANNQAHRDERVETLQVPRDATWMRVYFQPVGELHDLRIVGRGKGAK